jgi:hypothetical protein
VASQINAQLAAQQPTLLAFVPISVPDLRQRYLDHHEQVLHSTLGRGSDMLTDKLAAEVQTKTK